MLSKVFLFVCLIGFAISGSIYDIVINAVTCDCDRPSNLDVSKTKAYYYNFETNSNESYLLHEAAAKIKARSDFDKEQCFHIFIPGFTNDINSPASNTVRCALSKTNCNSKKITLVIIDHSEYTSGSFLEEFNHVKLYRKAINYSKSIAIAIGEFIADILSHVKRDFVMASGHSLGGQMVGRAAEVSQKRNYTLKFVLAIDPAGPCFEERPDEHVKSEQADLVVAIHCNVAELGTDKNLTDFDVYSGDGVTQEGCFGGGAIDLLIKGEASSCSHEKCVPISLQTALQKDIWEATQCNSYEEYSNGSCDKNDKTVIAYDVAPTGSQGVYFFNPDTDNLECA